MTGTPPPAGRHATDGVPRSLPLERRLPLLILGLLAFVLAISLFVSYYEIRVAAETSGRDRLMSLSRVLASTVQQQLSTRLVAMHRLAADTAVTNALKNPSQPPSAAATAALAAIVTRADSLTPARLLTPDGRVVGGPAVHLETPADAERFRTEIQGLSGPADSSHIGKWYTANGHASFWMTVPVRQNGQLLGYIAQERRLNTSQRALQPFRDLIGKDIELYFRNAGDSTWVDLTGASVPPPAAPSSDSLAVFVHGAKGRVLASTVPLRGSPFLITVEYPMAELLARPQSTIRTLAVIAILLAVVGASIAWFISRQMTRPLVELTGAAEAIAEGQYAQRVEARGSDEIGRLGTAFNRMAEQVQVSSIASDEAVVRLTNSAATQEFLAEASRILAESLSDQTLLSDLARYCVPTISDYCSIHVVDDDGSIRRVETAHYNSSMAPAVRALVNRYEYRIDGPGPVPDVIRGQKPTLVPRLDTTSILANAPDTETARLLTEIGPTAFMMRAVDRARAGARRDIVHDDGLRAHVLAC